MSTKSVIFSNPDDVIDFVKIVEKYPFDMDMKRGRYIVDAKSMLGVFSLPTFDNVEIGAEEEDAKELREKLENLNLIRE